MLFAIWDGNPEIVQCLIREQNFNVNALDSWGNPMLHVAILADDPAILRILVDAGADVNAKDSKGYPMLSKSRREGNAEVTQILVDAGARE